MLEGIVLGLIQGIAEWLPVSSEGMIVLAEANLFGRTDASTAIELALFLHLGTFLAALIYFRRDVAQILRSAFVYKKCTDEERSLLSFLIIATLTSGILGFGLFSLIESFEAELLSSGRALTLLVGVLLLATAWLQIKKKSDSTRGPQNLNISDSLYLGIAQGLAVLPGLSRSGLTVSTLLLRKVDEESALKLSFLLSLPIVLAGNIALNLDMLSSIEARALWGLLFSFLSGLTTIHLLIKIARRVNFGVFVGIFGLLMIVAGIIG